MRGQAYLAAGRASEAATEFRKIIDRRGIVLADPVGAMARLQLARALVLAGDHSGAKTQYMELLNLWKEADPNVPAIRQAKSEFATLLRKAL